MKFIGDKAVKKDFLPFEITLNVESPEEARLLRHVF